MRLMPLCAWLLALRGTPGDSGEVNLLDYNGLGPCGVTLTPEKPCEEEDDDVRCPYLFNVPPLTIHLPKQFRELERIVEELQTLKDDVDELRRMCADCTVRQPGRECDTVNEGMSRNEDGRNWLNAESLKNASLEDGTKGVKSENRSEGCRERDAGKITAGEKNKGGAETPRNTGVVNEKRGEGKQVDVSGTFHTQRAKEGDKWATGAGGSGKSADLVIKIRDDKSREGKTDDRKNDMSGKENSRGDVLEKGEEGITGERGTPEDGDPHVGQERTEEIEIKPQNKENSSSYVINKSDFHGEHTNKMHQQHVEGRKKEMEKGIKVERGNEKLIQAEGREKDGASERGKLDEETGQEIKTEGEIQVRSPQTDGDGGLASSEDATGTNAASKGQTPSTSGGGPRQESADPDTARSYGSSHGSPAVSGSPPPFPGVNEGLTTSADGLQTQTFMSEPGSGAQDSKHGKRQGLTAAGSTPATPVDHLDEVMRPTAAATTTANTDATMAAFPGPSDHRQSPTKKIWAGMKPSPENNSRFKNVRINNSRKPDQGPVSDKKTRHDQKQKPPYRKPLTRPRPEDPRLFRGLKPNQRAGSLPAEVNLKNSQTQRGVRGNTTGQNRPNIQKSASKPFLPVQRPMPRQRNHSVHVNNPEKLPPIEQKPRSTQIPNITQNQKMSISEKRRLHLLKMERTLRKPASEGKPKVNQNPELNQRLRDVQERSTPQPFHNTELLENGDVNPLAGTNDLASGQKVTPTLIPINIPNQSQKPDSNPDVNSELGMTPNLDNQELEKEPRSESNVKFKVQQTPTDGEVKTPQRNQTPRLSTKPVSEPSPRAESSNTPLSKQRSHTRPADRPGATSAERSKPSIPLKPILKTETDLDSLQMTRATIGSVQISQTNTPPSPVQPLSGVNIHPGETEVNSVQVMTKTLSSLEDGVNPYLNTLPEDLVVSPVRRIMSDPKPQTSAPAPATQATAIPNRMAQEDKQVQVSKPDQRSGPEALLTDQETRGPEHTATILPPVQSPTGRLTQPLPESAENPRTDQNPNPEVKTADGRESENSLKPDGGSASTDTQEPESENRRGLPPKPVQTPLTGMTENPVDSEAGSEPDPNLFSRKKFPEINPEPVPAPKSGLKPHDSDLTAHPETQQPYKTPVRGFKTPLPDPTPSPTLEPAADRAPSPPPGHRSPSTPVAEPGATSAQGSTPSLPLKSGSKPKPELDPSQMTKVSSEPIWDPQMNLAPSSGPVKLLNDVTNPPGDPQVSTIKTMTLDPKPSSGHDGRTVPHLQTLPGDFDPNSRITSPQDSQTTAAPPSVQMTDSPNRAIPQLFSGVPPPSESPAQPKQVSHVDSTLHHNVESTTRSQNYHSDQVMNAASSSSSPDLRAAGPAKSGPPDSSRELRVKINQVAAFFNNSRSSGGRHPERSEDKQSGSRPGGVNSKLLTRTPSKGKACF